MAERYPTYYGGVSVAAPVQIDFADQREAARSAAQSAQSWDRIGNWFERIGNEQAKIEGEIYQAKNPVTVQQIADAKAEGRDIADLMPSGISVYDRARRKVAIEQMTTEMEIQARREMTKIALDAEKREIPSDQVMKSIQSVIDGYGATLGQVAPEGLQKFRASTAVIGNSMYMKAASDELSRYKKNRELEANLAMEDINKALPSLIAAGDTVDPKTGATITIDDRVSVLRSDTVKRIARMTEDPDTARRYVESFDKAVKSAKISAVEKFVLEPGFLSNPTNLYKIQSGNLGSVSAVYRSLDADEQAKISARFMTEIGNRNSLTTFAQAQSDRAESLKLAALLKENASLSPDDFAGRTRIANQIAGIRIPESATIYSKLMDEKNNGKDNATTVYMVRAFIENRTIKDAPGLYEYVGRGISADTATKLLPQIEAFQNADVQEASNMFYRHFGIPADKIAMKMDPTAQTRQVALLTQGLMDAREKAMKAMQPFDATAYAREKIEALSKSRDSDPGAKAAIESVKNYEAQLRFRTGREVSIKSATDVDALVKAGALKEIEAADLYRKLDALSKYGGDW